MEEQALQLHEKLETKRAAVPAEKVCISFGMILSFDLVQEQVWLSRWFGTVMVMMVWYCNCMFAHACVSAWSSRPWFRKIANHCQCAVSCVHGSILLCQP